MAAIFENGRHLGNFFNAHVLLDMYTYFIVEIDPFTKFKETSIAK